MTKTPDLIDSLAADLRPVRRLHPPLVRAALWLALVAIVIVLLAVSQGVRPDLFAKLHDPEFDLCPAAAILTGVLSACATFMLSLPDRSRLWCLLPLPALGLWLAIMGSQCLVDWIDVEPGGVGFTQIAGCSATMVLTGLPLSLAMLVMVRYAAPLRPMAATLTGSLAVATITGATIFLFHKVDASLLMLIWNVGVVALFVSIAAAFGSRMFSWVGPRRSLSP